MPVTRWRTNEKHLRSEILSVDCTQSNAWSSQISIASRSSVMQSNLLELWRSLHGHCVPPMLERKAWVTSYICWQIPLHILDLFLTWSLKLKTAGIAKKKNTALFVSAAAFVKGKYTLKLCPYPWEPVHSKCCGPPCLCCKGVWQGDPFWDPVWEHFWSPLTLS